jgi:hypothetical protein
VDGQPTVSVQYDPLELLHFMGRDFAPMNLMCERAGMFEDRIEQREAITPELLRVLEAVADALQEK